MARNGDDVTIIIAESAPGAGDGGSVLLKGSLDDNGGRGVETIDFADGTFWNKADMRSHVTYIAGTDGNE
ncbi:calcium-binding protein [Mesorhizobium sp. ORM6]